MDGMLRLKSALILLVTFACGGMALAQDTFPKGEIIDPVLCQDQPDQSYALYLPISYTPEKRWPVLYCFDPGARGKVPVELFQEAAERLGYLVAGSNNSRNGPWEPTLRAIKAMLTDTQARFAIDTGRAYSTGMSGGGSPALKVAEAGAAGTIICASVTQFTDEQLKPVTLDIYTTAGIADFNYEYLRTFCEQLVRLGKAVRFETFDGGHGWPPKELAANALEWMELRAMRRGLRGTDEAFIDSFSRSEQARAAALEAAGKRLQALRLYEALVRDFDGLRDVTACQAKVADLSAQKEIKEAVKWENSVAEAHYQRMSRLVAARTTLENPQIPDLGRGRGIELDPVEKSGLEASRAEMAATDIRRSVSSMRKQMEKPFADHERVISQRVLDNFYIDTIYRASEQMGSKDYRRAISNYQLCAEVRPKAVTPLLELARAYAAQKDKKKAVEYLTKAIDAGLKDPQVIRATEFESLRGEKRFEQLMARLATP
jgi:tetratricopeptide (TPR) repeat protein